MKFWVKDWLVKGKVTLSLAAGLYLENRRGWEAVVLVPGYKVRVMLFSKGTREMFSAVRRFREASEE